MTFSDAIPVRRYGVVFYGRRDHYQVALALREVGALARLFTDFYTSHQALQITERLFPALAAKLRVRHCDGIERGKVSADWPVKFPLSRYLAWRGFSAEERFAREEDFLSKRSARYFRRHPDTGIVCYSYYWNQLSRLRAAGKCPAPAIVFQVHPVPSHIREVITADRNRTGLAYLPEPEETASPVADTLYLDSLQHADGVITASSFTAKGLTDASIPAEKLFSVPYGFGLSDTAASKPAGTERWKNQVPLRLLWVGQIAYRKGAHHLFEALRHFPTDRVQLDIVSRSPVPAELAALWPPHARHLNTVSDAERQSLYNSHHLFVLPSLVEGFGLVYTEAMAEGLPILATWNTGAPDVMRHGVEGFVVEPGSPDAVAEVIEQCLSNPALLPQMSQAAREAAGNQTWGRFRAGIRSCIAAVEQQGAIA